MRVGEARAAAVEWVREHAADSAAYFTGSTVGMPDDAELPVGSDVDVAVVVDEAGPKPGRFLSRGALLEVTPVTRQEVRDALGSYHLAGGPRTDTVFADPTGELSPELPAHLGCADWTPARTRHHLAALATTFDRTVPVSRTPFPHGGDITAAARPTSG